MPNLASSQRSGKKDILSVANGVVVQRHKSSILPAQIEVSTYREARMEGRLKVPDLCEARQYHIKAFIPWLMYIKQVVYFIRQAIAILTLRPHSRILTRHIYATSLVIHI